MNKTLIKSTFSYFTILTFVFLSSCSNESDTSRNEVENNLPEESSYDGVKDLFELMPASQTGVDFSNNIKDSMQLLCFSFEYSFNGGGVAVGDINNDGLQDLFFTSTLERNRLYLNMGDWKFKDITDQAGVNNDLAMDIGTSMIDINNDGFLDIYVCKSGAVQSPEARRNSLYINQGNLTFKDEAKAYGLDDPSFATQTYFSDFDLDGDLDAYCVNHPINWGKESQLNLKQDTKGNISVIQDTQRLNITDRYLENQNGKFVDKTYEYGVDNAAFGLSGAVYDFNEDGYPDIYICNDYSKPDRLMINQKGKGFKDEIQLYFDNITASAMGSDIMDVNDDGKMDLFVNDMMPSEIGIIKQQQSYVNYDLATVGRKFGYHDQFKYNSMQVKMEDGLYSNHSYLTKTDKTGWSWAVLGEDYDHNGHTDLFIANGYLKDVTNMDYSKFVLDSLRKTKKTSVSALYKDWVKIIDSLYIPNYFYANNGDLSFTDVSKIWNSGPASYSNGAAFADLDNDGDLDLIVNNINDPAFLMRNNLEQKSNSKSLRLTLKSEGTNYGSTLQANFADGSTKTKYYHPIRGFVSSVEQIVHFAIPEGKSINSVDIIWPNRTREQFTMSGKTGMQTITQKTGQKISSETPEAPKYFTKGKVNYKHAENEFIDFKREPLLHFKNSCEGPAVASGDLNGDGKDDMIIGGAYNQKTTLMLGNGNLFSSKNIPAFENSLSYEDVAMELGDIDGDGDLDLVAIAGGYQWKAGADQYGLKVFTNDGKANFTALNITSPKTNNTSVTLLDVDNDKDLDIFVGAGPIPGAYPTSDASYIMINNGGNFTMNKSLLPDSGMLGIVKSAKAADLNGDSKMDLIIGGEWTPIQILINNGKSFQNETAKYSLEDSNGFWQSIKVTDIDNDGDLDILAGNLGLNSFFKASIDKPTCVYASDFDGNGENDPIMCTYFGDKSYPVHSRDEILEQMTTLRKKYLRYSTFANEDLTDMFGAAKVKAAKVFVANTFATTLFINNGDSFEAQILPNSAQLSMTKDIGLLDVDKDGKDELIIVGNYWETDYDFGKYDASIGAILKRNADGSFSTLTNTGFIANLNARSINILDKNKVVIGNNDGPLQLYSLK